MDLDKRITDTSKIMDCTTIEESRKYMHTSGYFADNLEDFANLDTLDMSELAVIQDDSKYPYGYNAYSYFAMSKFFLPCTYVSHRKEKEKEKKYRPFTLVEFEDFINNVPFHCVTYRRKGFEDVYHLRYGGYIIYEDKSSTIILGHSQYTLESLMKEYELMIDNKWQPFGVEEN